MELSVGFTFEPGLISSLASFKSVREVYGKLDKDIIGGGRSTYTLRHTSSKFLQMSVQEAHKNRIEFNYLINSANLNGLEQTKQGQKKIRQLLDFISSCQIDSVTVASPYLATLVRTQYPQLKIRVGVFAVVDTPLKARQWEDMGIDTICVSGIACNRDFRRLKAIRKAVSCNLQLIVNASCLAGCSHELTHMQILSQSSRKKDPLNGFVMDYCFLNCSSSRLKEPINYIRSIWIRPEDLHYYEDIGYNSFKIVERSSPKNLVIKRVAAYENRSFTGNLWELIAPVAYITSRQKAPLRQRIRVIRHLLKPHLIKMQSIIKMKKYSEKVMPSEDDFPDSPVYIDNEKLDGFIDGIQKRDCTTMICGQCNYCQKWTDKVVTINPQYKSDVLRLAEDLESGLKHSTHWL